MEEWGRNSERTLEKQAGNICDSQYRAVAWLSECVIQESGGWRVFWRSVAVLRSVVLLFFKHLPLEWVT